MRITIAGDFTTKHRGLSAVKQKRAFSDDIINLFKRSDLSIVNLESPVANNEDIPIDKIGPNLYTSFESIDYLKESGIDVLTLANNHFFDYGLTGVSKTIESINNNKLYYIGGGRNKNEYRRFLYIENDNHHIAILNYCEAEFSVNEEFGSNHIDPINIYYDVNDAKKKADFIIVIIHGGHEGYNLPSPRMQKLYRYIIDLGANTVINHHQHCYSGYEDYKNGRIYYGLGNFYFDQYSDHKWNEGFIVDINIENHIIKYNEIPYIQCLNDDVFVRLMNTMEKENFNSNIDKLNSIINDENKIIYEFREFCKNNINNYNIIFSPYSNRFLRTLCKRGLIPSFLNKKRTLHILNNIRCESHRDITIFSLIQRRLNYDKNERRS